MKKLFALLFAAVIMASMFGCSGDDESDTEIGESIASDEETTQAGDYETAQLIGTAQSPDGKYEVKLVGQTDVPAMGIVPPETVDVCDVKSGKVMWQTDGAYVHNVSWSNDGRYLALAVTARVWCTITVIDTETWASWEFALPDGSSLPNYIFLSDDTEWCVWKSDNTVVFTVDNGEGVNVSYSCDMTSKDGKLSGTVTE